MPLSLGARGLATKSMVLTLVYNPTASLPLTLKEQTSEELESEFENLVLERIDADRRAIVGIEYDVIC